MIISLTGFMGCGKSSVGRELSKLLCCRFMDLDEVIETQEGRKITEIFETEGEEGFRKIEARTLECIIRKPGMSSPSSVLALGGGAVMRKECEEMVHKDTTCVYLRASVDQLLKNLEGESEHRPMLASGDLRGRIEELMALRSGTYERTAHIIIDTDAKGIGQIAGEIVSALG